MPNIDDNDDDDDDDDVHPKFILQNKERELQKLKYHLHLIILKIIVKMLSVKSAVY